MRDLLAIVGFFLMAVLPVILAVRNLKPGQEKDNQ
jgi:hypothetical protein